MGETGVGKSTVSNVLTGQSPDFGCWKIGAQQQRVATNTTDHGCFPLLDGSYDVELIIVDTPGLNDQNEEEDVKNIMTIERYYRNPENQVPATTAFMILLTDMRVTTRGVVLV